LTEKGSEDDDKKGVGSENDKKGKKGDTMIKLVKNLPESKNV
jgi:hypothetical protein